MLLLLSRKRAGPTGVSQAALERTRKNVRMLDDVYKSVIVLITDKYVHSEDDYPAGSAAIDLFGKIQKKGWHELRLIDATGKPYTPGNVAKDAFEKEGIKQLKAGKDYFEQVVEKSGKSYLRAMTPVPVVMQKCVMCHRTMLKPRRASPSERSATRCRSNDTKDRRFAVYEASSRAGSSRRWCPGPRLSSATPDDL